MKGLHPARQKAELQQSLTVDVVLTLAQIERRGWAEAVAWLELPTLTRTCRVRATDAESGRDLTFVALSPADLQRPPRELMHLSGLAEARLRLTLADGEEWRHVKLKGAKKHHQPDAEIVQTLDDRLRSDWSVEVDAGYSRRKIEDKVLGAIALGYTRVYWATTIHTRVRSVMRQVQMLKAAGRLPELCQIETRYINFWSATEPYVNRRRCHKPMGLSQSFPVKAP